MWTFVVCSTINLLACSIKVYGLIAKLVLLLGERRGREEEREEEGEGGGRGGGSRTGKWAQENRSTMPSTFSCSSTELSTHVGELLHWPATTLLVTQTCVFLHTDTRFALII